jgi:hypothetical protein
MMTLDDLRYLTTDGYDVIVEAYALHPSTTELCLLSLVGEPDAIKAIKATLSIGLPFNITGITRCCWPKQADTFFTMLQRRLPSGAQAILWLPQHGTSVGVQHDTRAFIISRDQNPTSMPPTFVDILDRVLACPIRPEWGQALWVEAQQKQWVQRLDSYNCTVWEFLPQTEEIIAWLQKELRSRRLMIPTPPLTVTRPTATHDTLPREISA